MKFKYFSIALIVLVLLALPLSSIWVTGSNIQQLTTYTGQQAYPQAGVIPTFSISDVDTDDAVTIQTYNFPANDTFVVTMGAFGTKGIGGVQVATTKSGDGGTFSSTYDIPESLQGTYRLAIRLESPTTGYYSYNWFYNDESGVPVTAAPATGGPYPSQGSTSSWIDIISVVEDETVTIQMNNLVPNDVVQIHMNYMGTEGVNGKYVGTLVTDEGGSHRRTIKIPKRFHGDYQIAIRVESNISNYVAYNWFYNDTTSAPSQPPATGGPYATTPTYSTSNQISILSVNADESVRIRMYNLIPNDVVQIYMHYMGTQGIGGKYVSTLVTDDGGTRDRTLKIPDLYHGEYQIAVRVESNMTGYTAYNWFYNDTSGVPVSAPATGGPYPTPVYSAGASISILSVVPDEKVTIQMNNLPPQDVLQIHMGFMGTNVSAAKYVGTVVTDEGGEMRRTIKIPKKFHDEGKIAIWVDSNQSGYSAYNWFYNDQAASYYTDPDPSYSATTLVSSLSQYPTADVVGGVAGESVTVQGMNFPANETLEVRMNYMGTDGVEGTLVETISTGDSGEFTGTFAIPEEFQSKAQLSIRVENSSSGHYAYNWFSND